MPVQMKLKEIQIGVAKLKAIIDADSMVMTTAQARTYREIYDIVKPRYDLLMKSAPDAMRAEEVIATMTGLPGSESMILLASEKLSTWNEAADTFVKSKMWSILQVAISGQLVTAQMLADAKADVDRSFWTMFKGLFSSPWVLGALAVAGALYFGPALLAGQQRKKRMLNGRR